MKLTIKLLFVIVALGLVFVIEFALAGDYFEFFFNQQRCAAWFAGIKPLAWAIGIILLVSDILLPIPASGVIAALGSVYGIWWGALIGSVGVIGGAYAGYFVARYAGQRWIHYLASEQEIAQFQVFFDQWGGWAIIVSRIMPVLPEVVAILAGTAGMSHSRFAGAVTLGAFPVCILFSYIGFSHQETPLTGVVLATLLPLVLWPGVIIFANKMPGQT